jgi:hypothetical protein
MIIDKFNSIIKIESINIMRIIDTRLTLDKFLQIPGHLGGRNHLKQPQPVGHFPNLPQLLILENPGQMQIILLLNRFHPNITFLAIPKLGRKSFTHHIDELFFGEVDGIDDLDDVVDEGLLYYFVDEVGTLEGGRGVYLD